ncbi:MAG TPA: membrane protein insertase YidC, partial [Gammaproteobacteria bacterium]|nr:membrane protein insertase YidC [Gammaproteobacteria bacterium]
MDWQRTLLIAALAVVSYMMILQWQKDYVDAPLAEQAESYSQSYPQDGTGDVPTEVSNASTADVPVDPTVTSSAPQPDTLTPTQGLIEVDTDVLSVKINPLGGDIVYVGLKDYPAQLSTPNVPITLLQSNDAHTYISQSGLIGPNGPDGSKDGRPRYSSEQNRYRMEDETLTVTLRFQQDNGALINKEFKFEAGSYVIDVNMTVENNSDQTWQGLMYGQIKRDSSEDPGLNSAVGFGLPTFLGGAYWDQEKAYNKISFEDMAEAPLNKQIPGGWLAMIQHYFMSAWIPDQDQTHHYSTRVAKGFNIIGFTTPKAVVAPSE